MIYIECKPDFILVKNTVNIPKRKIIHESGKPRICNKLRKNTKCLGIIDEDPTAIQPPYLKNLEEVNEEYKIRLLRDSHRNNYLIVICPRIEEWILWVCKRNKINLQKYKFPNDATRFHKIVNANLENFEKLVNKLKNTKELRRLGNLIEDFYTNLE